METPFLGDHKYEVLLLMELILQKLMGKKSEIKMELKKQIKIMKYIYIILRIVFFLGGILAMYFSSSIWIGTDEQWNKLLETNFNEFFFYRELTTLSTGIFFIVIGLLINLIFRKIHGINIRKLKRIFILELLITLLMSIILVLKALVIVKY